MNDELLEIRNAVEEIRIRLDALLRTSRPKKEPKDYETVDEVRIVGGDKSETPLEF